jgi:hypothetical protein
MREALLCESLSRAPDPTGSYLSFPSNRDRVCDFVIEVNQLFRRCSATFERLNVLPKREDGL